MNRVITEVRRLLLESDVTVRRAERQWKIENTPESLANYIVASLRIRNRIAISSNDNQRHLLVYKRLHNIGWEVVIGSHHIIGAGRDIHQVARGISEHFYS